MKTKKTKLVKKIKKTKVKKQEPKEETALDIFNDVMNVKTTF